MSSKLDISNIYVLSHFSDGRFVAYTPLTQTYELVDDLSELELWDFYYTYHLSDLPSSPDIEFLKLDPDVYKPLFESLRVRSQKNH